MSNFPKVSVIMPSLNVVSYIRESIESVVSQTLQDIEIICVDAGSTDGTLEILKEYASKDNRIKIILSDKKSYGRQVNIGFDAARGEYLGIVETDDYVAVNMFEELYETALKNKLDFVKSDFYRFIHDKDGRIRLKLEKIDTSGKNYGIILCPARNPSNIKFKMNTWTGIYKREFIQRHNIRHNESPGASYQDNGFFFQTFVFAENAMLLDKAFYFNRRDNPNSSVKSGGKVYCMNIEYDYIMDILKRDWVIWEKFRYMYWWKKFHNYLFTLGRIDRKHKKEYLIRMSREFGRALQLNELDKRVFSDQEWGRITSIVNNYNKYYSRYVNVPIWIIKIWTKLPDRIKFVIKKIIWRK